MEMKMKNRLTLTAIILSLLIIVSCGGSKIRPYYSGTVVDEARNPIAGVLVSEYFPAGNSDTSDNAGYFKIKRTDGHVSDLIFSKKGYRTGTAVMVYQTHGEKARYSDLITTDSSKWLMRKIVCRDSILNGSDILRFFDNDSVEMRRDERLIFTQYLNRPNGGIIYRYWDYSGRITREVYNIDTEIGQIHFRDYHKYDSDSVENIGYISVSDSIPNPSNDDLSGYRYVSVIKTMQDKQLLSETYLLWQSLEDCIAGGGDDYLASKEYYNDDNYSYKITKYTDNGTVHWLYYTNGQLHSHWDNECINAGMFSSFAVNYDSLGRKTEETTWEHLYPEWGTSYNHTFSIKTMRTYYPNGKLKSLKKTKSFVDSDECRCDTWIYYNEQGKVLKTEQYGDCYDFELEEENREIY